MKMHNTLAALGIQAGDRLVLALSGGRDSMLLCVLLQEAAESFPFSLEAVHIHHGLRAESDGEEQFVRSFCAERGVPLTVHRLQLAETLAEGKSFEADARAARYRVFDAYVKAGKTVVTAHHMDDNIETFFINLMRGCGVKGLCAIPEKRAGYIRPLLSVSRAEIDALVLKMGVPSVEDASNTDTRFLRNFLRARVLPQLRARRDVSLDEGFATTLENLREEAQALDTLAETLPLSPDLPRAVGWRKLSALCPFLTRERFSKIWSRYTAGEDFTEQVKGNTFCVCKKGVLSFLESAECVPLAEIPLADGVTLSDGRRVYLKEIYSTFTKNDIDCATIVGTPRLRSRRAGDEITLRARPCKSLKKLFSEAKVTEREHRAVLCDEKGVLWVEGFGTDRRAAANEKTKKAWRIMIQ